MDPEKIVDAETEVPTTDPAPAAPEPEATPVEETSSEPAEPTEPSQG